MQPVFTEHSTEPPYLVTIPRSQPQLLQETAFDFTPDGILRNLHTGEPISLKTVFTGSSHRKLDVITSICSRQIRLRLFDLDMTVSHVQIPGHPTLSMRVLHSTNLFTHTGPVLILLQGDGVGQAGVWATRLLLHAQYGLNSGSQIELVRRAHAQGYAVLLANGNEVVSNDAQMDTLHLMSTLSRVQSVPSGQPHIPSYSNPIPSSSKTHPEPHPSSLPATNVDPDSTADNIESMGATSNVTTTESALNSLLLTNANVGLGGAQLFGTSIANGSPLETTCNFIGKSNQPFTDGVDLNQQRKFMNKLSSFSHSMSDHPTSGACGLDLPSGASNSPTPTNSTGDNKSFLSSSGQLFANTWWSSDLPKAIAKSIAAVGLADRVPTHRYHSTGSHQHSHVLHPLDVSVEDRLYGIWRQIIPLLSSNQLVIWAHQQGGTALLHPLKPMPGIFDGFPISPSSSTPNTLSKHWRESLRIKRHHPCCSLTSRSKISRMPSTSYNSPSNCPVNMTNSQAQPILVDGINSKANFPAMANKPSSSKQNLPFPPHLLSARDAFSPTKRKHSSAHVLPSTASDSQTDLEPSQASVHSSSSGQNRAAGSRPRKEHNFHGPWVREANPMSPTLMFRTHSEAASFSNRPNDLRFLPMRRDSIPTNTGSPSPDRQQRKFRLARAWQQKAQRLQTELMNRVKAIVFTACPTVLNMATEGIGWGTHLLADSSSSGSPRIYQPSIINPTLPARVMKLREWFVEHSVHYVASDTPLDTHLNQPYHLSDEVTILSSGSAEHDLLPSNVLESAFTYFHSKLEANSATSDASPVASAEFPLRDESSSDIKPSSTSSVIVETC